MPSRAKSASGRRRNGEKYGLPRPGNGFCSSETIEPADAAQLFEGWIAPHAKQIQILRWHEPTHVTVKDGRVEKIASLGDAVDLTAYELEPQLVTGLFDGQLRSKRRLVKYDDIPKVMVDAVTSIEDRRFFHHSGVNYWRLLQAGWIDLRQGGNRQGGSTITMQVARGFFLSPEKKLKRKLTEILISIELEQRFSKKQIFELYANQVDMGQRGSFTITGFGEAAQAYFGKDLKDITLPEAALLAGLVQRPEDRCGPPAEDDVDHRADRARLRCHG